MTNSDKKKQKNGSSTMMKNRNSGRPIVGLTVEVKKDGGALSAQSTPVSAAESASVATCTTTNTTATGETTSTATGSTDFVQNTRRDLRKQMRLLREKMDLVDRLDAMKGRLDDKLDYLFGLIDRDGSGSVDSGELATILRLRNSDLSEADATRRAEAMVAAFDADGNAEMDRGEFETFIRTMLVQLRLDPDEFMDFLIWNIVFPEAMHNSSNKGTVKASSKPKFPSVPAVDQPRERGRQSFSRTATAASPAEAGEVQHRRRSSLQMKTTIVGGNVMTTVPVRARGKSRSRGKATEFPE